MMIFMTLIHSPFKIIFLELPVTILILSLKLQRVNRIELNIKWQKLTIRDKYIKDKTKHLDCVQRLPCLDVKLL